MNKYIFFTYLAFSVAFITFSSTYSMESSEIPAIEDESIETRVRGLEEIIESGEVVEVGLPDPLCQMQDDLPFSSVNACEQKEIDLTEELADKIARKITGQFASIGFSVIGLYAGFKIGETAAWAILKRKRWSIFFDPVKTIATVAIGLGGGATLGGIIGWNIGKKTGNLIENIE